MPSRFADPQRRLICRPVVSLGECHPNSYPVGRIEETFESSGHRPSADLCGVLAGCLQVAARCGEQPKVSEKLVIAQAAALRQLGHLHAVPPDLCGPRPAPSGDQVQHHHPAGLDDID